MGIFQGNLPKYGLIFSTKKLKKDGEPWESHHDDCYRVAMNHELGQKKSHDISMIWVCLKIGYIPNEIAI